MLACVRLNIWYCVGKRCAAAMSSNAVELSSLSDMVIGIWWGCVGYRKYEDGRSGRRLEGLGCLSAGCVRRKGFWIADACWGSRGLDSGVPGGYRFSSGGL